MAFPLSGLLRVFALLCLSACAAAPASVITPPPSVLRVTPVAEKIVDRLPAGPLYWRIETFATAGEAQAAAGPFSLTTEAAGKAWLATLGPRTMAAARGRLVADIGPAPVIDAPRYLLRINRAGGPPGAVTSVHTHPGSEAFYVLTGQLSQKTAHGVARVDAGHAMNGHGPGMVMQLTSTGATDLDQLVFFVVDASKPFSSPATFE